MEDLTLTIFGNGSIRFIPKVDAAPGTSETTGNVTVHNAGRPEIPSHFETTTTIQIKIEAAGISAYTSFHLNDIVLAEQADVSYRQIEDKAARRIAPILRALADQIDEEMARFDEKEAERKAGL